MVGCRALIVWKRDGFQRRTYLRMSQIYPAEPGLTQFAASASGSHHRLLTSLVKEEEAPKSFRRSARSQMEGKIVKAHPGYTRPS